MAIISQEGNKDILLHLECPSCMEYMTQKIFVCLTGHSLCSSCWRKLHRCPQCKSSLSETRNYTLESVSKLLRFPCPHVDYGCSDMLLPDQLDDHTNFCSFRIYKCRINRCKWEGRRHKIRDHWLESHKKVTMAGNSNICLWGPSKINDLELIIAHNEIFFFYKKVSGKQLHFVVQYIGRDEDVIQYGFKVTIFSEQYNHRKIEISENCHNDHLEDISEIIDSGFSACIPLNVLTTYSVPHRGNHYKIEILKI